jgi:hypothetical protein
MAVADRYTKQARADFVEEVEAGATFRVRERRDELDGRSLHNAWIDGDQAAVEHWLESEYTRTEAIVAAHRADAEYMARVIELQRAAAARRADRAVRSA